MKVTFTGAESAALPGLLLPDGGSPLGIALGIETMAGSPVALNKPSQGYALANGSNSLQLQVYIQVSRRRSHRKASVSVFFFRCYFRFGV